MTHDLEVDGIQFNSGERKNLTSIYLKCTTGKITGLLGRNGQGKTCLMNIIYGSLEATSKSIRFDNISISNAFKRQGILLYLPQFNFIPNSLTLKRIFSDFNLQYSEFELYFPEFQSKYRYPIKHLSAGQRRLIEVYVIIMAKSHFAMLDEPFSHLMPLHIEKIKEILIQEKMSKGFIITDHLYLQIIDVCDSLYLLSDGKTHLTKSISDLKTLGYISRL